MLIVVASGDGGLGERQIGVRTSSMRRLRTVLADAPRTRRQQGPQDAARGAGPRPRLPGFPAALDRRRMLQTGRIVRSERRVSWVRLVEAGVADEVAVSRDDEVQGREHEFWRVYETSVGHVYGFLVRRCDRETAQDLTQEVFLQLA